MFRKNAVIAAAAKPNRGQAVEAAGVAAGSVLHEADIPGTEEATQVADRVDPGDGRGGCRPGQEHAGIAQNGPLVP